MLFLILILAALLGFLIIQHFKHPHSKLKNRIFYAFVAISVLFLTTFAEIPWTQDSELNLLISFSIIWLAYIPLVFKFAHKEINHSSSRIHRARQHFGSHVRHMDNDELHSHLKH